MSFLFLALVTSLQILFLTVVFRYLAVFFASFMASKRVSRSLASFMAVMTVFRFMYSSGGRFPGLGSVTQRLGFFLPDVPGVVAVD